MTNTGKVAAIMSAGHLFPLTRRKVCVVLLAGVLSGCSSENAVNRFLNDASNKINSIDTRIVGSQSNASGCRPDPYAPAITDPAPLFAG